LTPLVTPAVVGLLASTSAVGAPEPENGLSEKTWTRVKLLLALVIVGLLAVRVGALLDLAWEADGVGRSVVAGLFSGVVDDARVLVPVGLVTGWLALFVVDRTKALQRWFAVLAYLSLVAWLLVVENRWEQTGFVEFWQFLAIGLILGVTTGFGSMLLGSGRRREFPAAATGLFLVTGVLCLVGFLDVYLFASEQVTVTRNTLLPDPTSPVGAVVDLLAVGGFVSLFGWFVLYSYYRSVAVLGTSKELGIRLMAELLDHTQLRYEGTSGPGGKILREAKKPEYNYRKHHGERYFGFSYLSPKPNPRWTRVSAAPIDIDEDLGADTVDRIGERTRDAGLGQRVAVSLTRNLVPGGIRRRLQSSTGLLVESIASAEVVVFVMSIEELDGYRAGTLRQADLSPPDELTQFRELCDELDRTTKTIVVITITDADRVLEMCEAESVTEEAFSLFVRGQLLEIDDDDLIVVPTTWPDREDKPLVGVDEVRRKIDP
jgi:hypothetical protein